MYYLLVDDTDILMATNELATAELNRDNNEGSRIVMLAEEVDTFGKRYANDALEDIPPANEEAAAEAREARDALLSATDYLFYTDSPYSVDTVALYRTYRQELRDVPQQENFPQTIVWPIKP